jgi:hypothetical protein
MYMGLMMLGRQINTAEPPVTEPSVVEVELAEPSVVEVELAIVELKSHQVLIKSQQN